MLYHFRWKILYFRNWSMNMKTTCFSRLVTQHSSRDAVRRTGSTTAACYCRVMYRRRVASRQPGSMHVQCAQTHPVQAGRDRRTNHFSRHATVTRLAIYWDVTPSVRTHASLMMIAVLQSYASVVLTARRAHLFCSAWPYHALQLTQSRHWQFESNLKVSN